MKRIPFLFIATMAAFAIFTASGKPAETNQISDDVESNYSRSLENRTADILKALNLNDTNKVTRVHDILIAQYRALNTNDAPLRAAPKDTNVVAQVHAARKTLHNEFLSKLAEILTPEQIEQVKDKMTYGKVQFTYRGYLAAYPGLKDDQKAELLRLLKEAREEAMDGGSAEEKTAVFQRYKGKINNYLSKQGIQSQKQKAKAMATTNAPAAK